VANLNKPVEMISCCNALGEIVPIRLRMENASHEVMVASINEIVYKKESHIAGLLTFEYGCKIKIEGREQLVEVSYQVHSHRWLIKKIIC